MQTFRSFARLGKAGNTLSGLIEQSPFGEDRLGRKLRRAGRQAKRAPAGGSGRKADRVIAAATME